MRWMGSHGMNNLWIVQIGNPIQTVLWLLAYSLWADREVMARALRYTAIGYVTVWAIITLTIEDWTTFGHVTLPLQSILLVAVAAYFIVQRAVTSDSPVWRSDVFWVSAGVLLYFGPAILLGPVSRLLLPTRPELVLTAFIVKNAISAVAFVLVAWGVACPQTPSISGGSLSPQGLAR